MNNLIEQKSEQNRIFQMKKELLNLAKEFKDQEAIQILNKENNR
jgi:hypothetical protein